MRRPFVVAVHPSAAIDAGHHSAVSEIPMHALLHPVKQEFCTARNLCMVGAPNKRQARRSRHTNTYSCASSAQSCLEYSILRCKLRDVSLQSTTAHQRRTKPISRLEGSLHRQRCKAASVLTCCAFMWRKQASAFSLLSLACILRLYALVADEAALA